MRRLGLPSLRALRFFVYAATTRQCKGLIASKSSFKGYFRGLFRVYGHGLPDRSNEAPHSRSQALISQWPQFLSTSQEQELETPKP